MRNPKVTTILLSNHAANANFIAMTGKQRQRVHKTAQQTIVWRGIGNFAINSIIV